MANFGSINSYRGTVSGLNLNREATSLPPSGEAGGDLDGDYPNPILVDTGVTAGTYGDSLNVAQVTVDSKGRTIVASNVAIAFPAALPPDGPAGGDLTGTYPNPTLVTTGVVAGTYGDSTNVSQVTIDSNGRATAATNVPIAFPGPSGTAGGDLSGTYPNPTILLGNSTNTSGDLGNIINVPAGMTINDVQLTKSVYSIGVGTGMQVLSGQIGLTIGVGLPANPTFECAFTSLPGGNWTAVQNFTITENSIGSAVSTNGIATPSGTQGNVIIRNYPYPLVGNYTVAFTTFAFQS